MLMRPHHCDQWPYSHQPIRGQRWDRLTNRGLVSQAWHPRSPASVNRNVCFGSPKASRYCKSILWKIGFGEPVTVRSRDSGCQWEYRLDQWQEGLKTFHRLLHLPSILKLTAIISPGQSPRPPNQWPIGLVLWKPTINALFFTLLYFWCVDTFFGNLLLLLTDQNIFLSWSFREIRLGFILRFRCRQERSIAASSQAPGLKLMIYN